MSDAPLCAPPDPEPKPPKNVIPAGACDCHFHITAGPSPLVDKRSYTPPELSMTDYLEMRETLGLSRGVVVQPSTHGTDNRTTLNALPADDTMRAVVVVDQDCPSAELKRLADQGAVGARANLLFSSDARLEDLTGLARRIAEVGWHLQLLVDASKMAGLETLVRDCPIPVVLDHFGHIPAAKGVNEPGFQALLRLLDTGKLWVKLSGAYRICALPYHAAAPMAQALIAANPERLVWGSDWPHPAIEGPMPEDGQLLDLLFDWAGEVTARRILVENPQVLYGFEKWGEADGI